MFEFILSIFIKPIYCKINDSWYDLRYIAYKHPGGRKILEKYHEQDVTDKFYSISSHKNVDLEKYRINHKT
jgi:cytochrome b involved in lipid metabolism